jgi:hypothetical protein
LETFTVCGDEEFPHPDPLRAKLPLASFVVGVGSIDAVLEAHPEVSSVEVLAPLVGGGVGMGEPETVSTLEGVTGTEEGHRSQKGRWLCK